MSNTPEKPALHAGPCREKYWSELTEPERIQRLREIVRRQQVQIDENTKAIEQLSRLANEHCHAPSGQVLIMASARHRADLFGEHRSKQIGERGPNLNDVFI